MLREYFDRLLTPGNRERLERISAELERDAGNKDDRNLLEAMNELSQTSGTVHVPFPDLNRRMQGDLGWKGERVLRSLESLMQDGVVYEPQVSQYAVIDYL